MASSGDLVGEFFERVSVEAAVIRGLLGLHPDIVTQCVDLLNGCKGKIATTGVGASGFVARRMAHFLSLVGLPAFFYNPVDAAHGSLASVAPTDILLVFSKSGGTKELIVVTELLRHRGVTTLLVTCDAGYLAEVADFSVLLPISDDADPGGALVTGSSLLMSAWCDAIVAAICSSRQLGWQNLVANHPAGAVGGLSLEKTD